MEAEVVASNSAEVICRGLSDTIRQMRLGRVAFLGHILFGYGEIEHLDQYLSRAVILPRTSSDFFFTLSDLETTGIRRRYDFVFVHDWHDLKSAEGWRSVPGFPFGIIQLDLRTVASAKEIPWVQLAILQRSTRSPFVLCGYLGDASAIPTGTPRGLPRKVLQIGAYSAYLVYPAGIS